MAADAALVQLEAPAIAAPNAWRALWSAFRENKGAVLGLIVLIIVALLAVFADVVAPHSPIEQFRDSITAPTIWQPGGSWRFALGTDALGRDMLSRLIYGARISLFIGLT